MALVERKKKTIDLMYQAGKKTILHNVNLSVKPGQFTAVLGANGAGKSTLLKIFSGEQKASAGDVFINHIAIHKLSSQKLSLLRAVLPQHSHLTFPFSVIEVVLLGRLPYKTTQAQNLAIIRQLMEETEVWHLRDRIYTSLSGGEKQRVQLARIMAQITDQLPDSRYMLLDEPTSSLDMYCQHLLLGRAKLLCKQNVGVMAILHDLNLAAQYADYMLFLKNGKEVAQGAIEEVLTQEIVEDTFSHPVKIVHDPDSGRPIIYTTPTIHSIHKQVKTILNFHSNE